MYCKMHVEGGTLSETVINSEPQSLFDMESGDYLRNKHGRLLNRI